MERRTKQRLVVIALLGSLAALIAGGLALQLASGGIRGQSLSPAVLALALGVLGVALLVRRPRLPFAPLLPVNGLGFAVGTLAAGALDYGAAHSLARPLAQAAYAIVWLTVVLMAAWTLFILLVPGRALQQPGMAAVLRRRPRPVHGRRDRRLAGRAA